MQNEKTFTVPQLREATKALIQAGGGFDEAVKICDQRGLDLPDHGIATMLWLLCDQPYMELRLWADGEPPDAYSPGEDGLPPLQLG